MTAEAAASGKLDVGRVIAETFKVTGRNIVPFGILGLVLAGLPSGVLTFFQGTWLANRGAAAAFQFDATYFTNLGVGALISIVTMSVLQGALIFATVQDVNGRKAAVGEALAVGLRNFLPLLGLGVLAGIALACGFVLLFVPGLILACMWCVAGPALIIDNTGVTGAFGRSAQLTKGNRWRVFGLFVIIWILLLVLGTILGAISAAVMFSTPGVLENPAAAALSPVNIVVNVIQQTVTGVLFTAMFSVLYVELRKTKEGLGAEALADVFS